ncbi:MAG: 50S ribosomal protein L11 methyltransferase [Pararhizobium sp.]
MSQVRLFVSGTEAETARALDRMGEAFEDDGFAMGTMEIDEDAGLWEASLYLEEEDEAEQVGSRLAAALADAGLEGRAISREILPDIDWVAKSLEGLAPVRAGRFLVHGSHDRAKVRPGDRAIEIDAGQAFGTGHHGTTAGCLLMIQSVLNRQRVRRALDLGTGSGVLAIALRKLQPARVLATDIDPVATRVARANARNNHVTDIRFATAAGFHAPVFAAQGPFDLIVANILARPLMAMAPEIRAHLAPGGAVILSGILAEQRWKVLAAFNGQHLRHVRTLWRGGWVTILLR